MSSTELYSSYEASCCTPNTPECLAQHRTGLTDCCFVGTAANTAPPIILGLLQTLSASTSHLKSNNSNNNIINSTDMSLGEATDRNNQQKYLTVGSGYISALTSYLTNPAQSIFACWASSFGSTTNNTNTKKGFEQMETTYPTKNNLLMNDLLINKNNNYATTGSINKKSFPPIVFTKNNSSLESNKNGNNNNFNYNIEISSNTQNNSNFVATNNDRQTILPSFGGGYCNNPLQDLFINNFSKEMLNENDQNTTLYSNNNYNVFNDDRSQNFTFNIICESLNNTLNQSEERFKTSEDSPSPSCKNRFSVSRLPVQSDQNRIQPIKFECDSTFSYYVRNAITDEISDICHWRAKDFGYGSHWNYLQILYISYPSGWFVASDEQNNIIGNIFVMNLTPTLAFGGLYCVKKEYRCRGIGGKLWEQRKSYIADRNLGVNAVKSRIGPNTKLGMFVDFNINRYRATLDEEKYTIIKSVCDQLNYQYIYERVPFITQTQTQIDQISDANCKLSNINNHFVLSYNNNNMSNNEINYGTGCSRQSFKILFGDTLKDNHNFHFLMNDINSDSINQHIMNKLLQFDTHMHGGIQRNQFLYQLMNSPNVKMLLAIKVNHFINDENTDSLTIDLDILGYGVLRPRYTGYTIGPLYAAERGTAQTLLFNLLLGVPIDSPFDFMTVEQPEIESSNNTDSIADDTLIPTKWESTQTMSEMAQLLALPLETTLHRMYSKERVDIPLNNIYCIISSEAFLC